MYHPPDADTASPIPSHPQNKSSHPIRQTSHPLKCTHANPNKRVSPIPNMTSGDDFQRGDCTEGPTAGLDFAYVATARKRTTEALHGSPNLRPTPATKKRVVASQSHDIGHDGPDSESGAIRTRVWRFVQSPPERLDQRVVCCRSVKERARRTRRLSSNMSRTWWQRMAGIAIGVECEGEYD